MLRDWTRNLALLVLVAIVGLRPLISESYRTSSISLTESLEELQDPWASTTLVLDAITLVLGGGLLLGYRMRHPTGGVTGLETGLAIWLVGAIGSCVFAADKRPAINATFDLLSAAVLALALARSLDCPWKIRTALCTILASGAVVAAECADQAFRTLAETEAAYYEQREELWSSQGVSLDSEQVALFEQRMKAREASAFFSHSNVAGGYLILAGFAAIALAAAGWRRGDALPVAIVVNGLLAAGILGAILLTRGLGALGAGILGLALCGSRLAFAGWWRRNRSAVLVAGWSVALLAIAATIATGLTRGSLPGSSLDFRWQYWTASARMYVDNWTFGVGAENFGDRYLAYKSIESPEEVQNPHNLLVQFATEYGAAGLIGAIAMLLGGSIALSAPASPDPQRRSQRQPADKSSWHGHLAATALLALLIFGPRIGLLPSDQPALILWMTLFGLIVWVPAFLLSGGALAGVDDRQAWMRASAVINCGLIAFLVQDAINFALFVPGCRATFFALVGISAACRQCHTNDTSESRAPSPDRVIWLAGAVAALIVAAGLLTPIRAERALRAARSAADLPAATLAVHPAHAAFAQATRLDPLDATAPAEHARWLMRASRAYPGALNEALVAIDVATARSRFRVSHWRTKARIHMLRGQSSGDDVEFQQAVLAMRRAIELYPARPMSYVELGDCLLEIGTTDALQDAINSYERALELDHQRPDWERFRRLNERQKKEIAERIENARQRLSPH